MLAMNMLQHDTIVLKPMTNSHGGNTSPEKAIKVLL